ncbi:MAG TPA: phosphatase PAP2 family protein [Rhizomicrobium sp.]
MRRTLVLGIGLLFIGGAAFADAQKPHGYLDSTSAPDTTVILPHGPVKGTARYEADRKIFLRTRKLKGTARWQMAVNDDDYSDPAVAKDFTCALGVTINPTDEPHLTALISRMGVDLGRAGRDAKNFNKRKRPFLIDKGQTCVPITPEFAKSYDYPSGHSTYSWGLGMVLAEIAPDRATPILARARAYGESRVVCGVHNASAVDAGRTEASIVIAVLHSSAEFRADVEAARSELTAARAKATSPANCEAENALVAQPLY